MSQLFSWHPLLCLWYAPEAFPVAHQRSGRITFRVRSLLRVEQVKWRRATIPESTTTSATQSLCPPHLQNPKKEPRRTLAGTTAPRPENKPDGLNWYWEEGFNTSARNVGENTRSESGGFWRTSGMMWGSFYSGVGTELTDLWKMATHPIDSGTAFFNTLETGLSTVCYSLRDSIGMAIWEVRAVPYDLFNGTPGTRSSNTMHGYDEHRANGGTTFSYFTGAVKNFAKNPFGVTEYYEGFEEFMETGDPKRMQEAGVQMLLDALPGKMPK